MTASKTVYFMDYPTKGKTRSGLTIPFSESDASLFEHISPLSSLSLRKMIGFDSFSALEAAANAAGRPVATFARENIQKLVQLKPLPPSEEHSIASTFRGGKGSPLHDWYPYLEGYSPSFVQTIIRRYASEARLIFDPFCGSGTTALVAASMARTGLFAEVNPVCRLIIETKALALRLDDQQRGEIIATLRAIGSRISSALKECALDQALKGRFLAALGSRPIFDTKTAGLVLKLRTLIDKVGREHPAAEPFLTVAALRSLVPSSLLVRRGDLRFRTAAELAGFRADLVSELRSSIELIASDLEDVQPVGGEVRFVCDDAREAAASLREPVDAIITSPPYLNGTNYFRNTKIELCFLGHLKDKAGLRQFRDAAITAGINDVTIGKTTGGEGGLAPSVKLRDTLSKLSAAAYDVRIPAMVQSYFQEMGVVVDGLSRIIRPGGVAAIDLGDSCYGGVHVATDIILSEIMLKRGFKQHERIVLRERQSRDGGRLSQTLQIFERATETPRSAVTKRANRLQETSWHTFRTELPHQRGEMAKRNWGHPWHSLCSYQGKLKPSIASTLVEALLPRDRAGRLLDPFGGVGTLPFEARLQGHEAFAFDISPAAAVISKAKLGAVDGAQVSSVMTRLEKWVSNPRHQKIDAASIDAIKFNGPLRDYFNPRTFKEIVAARAFFIANPPSTPSEALVMSCLLHVLHGNRPYALSRRSHPITPFAPTGPAEYRPLIDRLTAKLTRALDTQPSDNLAEGRMFDHDATTPWPKEVRNLDAIITSPPFFDSTRFYSANWMRLWFAGWGPEDFSDKPRDFVDEQQKKTMDVYDPIFAQAHDRLRRGGVMAIHLGKSPKCDMGAALSVLGARHLDLIDNFSESVSHCESHGIRDKGTVTHHQYLLFRKRG